MEDYVEMGSIIQLKDGWFIDKETNIRFRMDDEGNAVDAEGNYLFEEPE